MSNTEHNTLLTFSSPDNDQEDIWLWMDDPNDRNDRVTRADMAAIVDSFFNLEPCNGQQEPSQTIDQGVSAESQEEEEEINSSISRLQDIIQGMFRLPYCVEFNKVLGPDYIISDVMVVRDDPLVQFEFNVTNGSVLNSVIVEEFVTETIEFNDASAVRLNYPVYTPENFLALGVFSVVNYIVGGEVFSGTPPGYSLDGDMLIHDDGDTTDIVNLMHYTRYDIVTVKILRGAYDLVSAVLGAYEEEPEDTDPAPNCFAFYKRKMYSYTAESPKHSTEQGDLCSEPDQEGGGTEIFRTRWETVTTYNRCRCSSTVVNEETSDPVENTYRASDPPDYPVNRRVFGGYVSCPDEEYEVGDVGDPEFYLKTCCETHKHQLPPCREIKGVKTLSIDSEEIKRLSDDYPGAVLVPIMPSEGFCGDSVTIYDVPQLDCCGFVDELEPLFLPPLCADEIGSNAEVSICVKGGKPPFTWDVSGSGYSLEESHTIGRENLLKSDDKVCGDASVKVTGDCYSVKFSISQTGVILPEITGDDPIIVGESQPFTLSVLGGVHEFTWSVTGDVILVQSSGRDAEFLAESEIFCGGTISVSDGCGNVDSVDVLSSTSMVSIDDSGFETDPLSQDEQRTIQAFGGEQPYTWDVGEGLTIVDTGSSTVTVLSDAEFICNGGADITVTESGCGMTDTAFLHADGTPIAIDKDRITPLRPGYQETIYADGGAYPTTWSFTGGLFAVWEKDYSVSIQAPSGFTGGDVTITDYCGNSDTAYVPAA